MFFQKTTIKIENLLVFFISSRNHRPRNVFVPDTILEIYAAVVSRAQLYHIPPLPSLCCGRVVAAQLPQAGQADPPNLPDPWPPGHGRVPKEVGGLQGS